MCSTSGRPWPQPAGHHPSHRVGIRTLACRGVPAQTRHGCSMQCSGHVARRAGARLAREDAFSGRHQADVGVDQQSTPHQAPFLNDGSYPETSRRSPPPAHALATSWGIWAALRKAIRAFRTNGIAACGAPPAPLPSLPPGRNRPDDADDLAIEVPFNYSPHIKSQRLCAIIHVFIPTCARKSSSTWRTCPAESTYSFRPHRTPSAGRSKTISRVSPRARWKYESSKTAGATSLPSWWAFEMSMTATI